MQVKTVDSWNEELCKQVSRIYEQAFAGKGAKPEKILRNMFRKKLCFLHVGFIEDEVVAMAITGELKGIEALLIDYLAVDEGFQHRGIGLQMVEMIKDWCLSDGRFNGMVIETEADMTPDNLARIQFWKKCGFTITDYVHHYIWVPETYRAMFVKLVSDSVLPDNGEQVFRFIGMFHKASYQGA
ncbi:GNAT family N-acetyltransferase [Neobacillus niacini]|uniref:GNAT family N-acetyltransferase n=1 Tax=Neobacillus niacini TaxID=86668 RepID=UPI0021CAFE09|nr:GNAT family N-acetyltransferase [Neobacillus niacini]MCM3764558.1 GNAT family N-acetyltransferase [Neobacillus niacini]